jgi:uncharacterized cupin superfamily protein
MAESAGNGWQAALVDEIPPVRPEWGSTWKSVRHYFGIDGYGINAATKDAGEVLIPEHDESESGQKEIFFVHAGEVTATVNGEEVTLPAGTFIAVEPAAKRQFVAASSPTTLIVVGAPSGRVYEIPGWEK